MLTAMQIRWMTVAAATCLLFTTSAVPNGQTPASVTAKPAFAEPSIAPDGSEIAFVSGGDIWTVPACRRSGAAPDLACRQRHAARSSRRTSRRVAFVSTRTGGGDIYVLTLATGDVRRRDVRRRRSNSSTAGRATGSGCISSRAPTISPTASTTSIAWRPRAARRCRSAATATPTSSSRAVARRTDARDERPRHRLRPVVAPRPQPHRRGGDLAAGPDRRRRAGGAGAR